MAERVASQREDAARRSGGDVGRAPVGGHDHPARIGRVVAMGDPQDRALADPGWPDQRDAFLGTHLEREPVEDAQHDAALVVQHEALRHVDETQHGGHAGSTEETRSCV